MSEIYEIDTFYSPFLYSQRTVQRKCIPEGAIIGPKDGAFLTFDDSFMWQIDEKACDHLFMLRISRVPNLPHPESMFLNFADTPHVSRGGGEGGFCFVPHFLKLCSNVNCKRAKNNVGIKTM